MKKIFLFLFLFTFINITMWWNLSFSFVPRQNKKVFVVKNDKSKFLNTKLSKYYVPSWVDYSFANVDKRKNTLLLYADNIVLAKFKLRNGKLLHKDYKFLQTLFKGQLASKYKKSHKIWKDTDQDGVPDSLDFQLGMYKSVVNSASYKDKYIKLSYPYGNVPNNIGVCTDVVIRSYLNAGISLQKKVYLDMKARKQSYGGFKGKTPDHSIEHRRVRRLIVLFKKYFRKMPVSYTKTLNTKNQWLPGDILFMSLIPGDKRISHVGVVSGNKLISSYPMLIHNAAKGFHAAEMDILWFQKVVYRFRPF